jgi:pentatricopeptide repeat protein
LRKLEEISNRDQEQDQQPPKRVRIATPIINVYLDALSHLGRNRDIQDAVLHLQSFPDQAPSKKSYAVLLRTYLQSLNLRKARLLLCEMMALGVPLDRDIVKIILQSEGRWAVSLDSVDALLDLLTSKPRDMELYNIIMTFSLDSIDSLLNMLTSGSRDMGIYNIIITAYLRRGRPDKARVVIDRTLKIGLHPDGNTFYALMQYQAAKEGSRGVSVILNSMEKTGYVAQSKHLNLLISTLAREEPVDLSSVTTLFRSHKIKPDSATCNIVLRALLRRTFDSQQIESHFQEMGRLGLRPDVYTYTILLNEYKYKSIPWQQVQKVLQIQFDLNPSNVNQVTLNTLLHRMIATFHRSPNRQNPPADSLPPDIDLHWDSHTLTSLVTAYLRSRDWSKIVSLHRELLKRQVKLDRYFYRVMVKALLDGNLYREATEVTSLLFDSDDIIDQIFGRECELRIAHSFFRNTGKGKNSVVQAVDRLLKFSDEKSIIISEKLCNLIGIAFLDIYLELLTVQLLESRYHTVGRFQDLEQGQRLGMSSWVILMRAYSRFGAKGIKQLRSCVERALADDATTPTSTFLNFLERIGQHPKFRRTCERDCDFFLETRLKYIQKPKPAPNHKGRKYLTKTSILRWTNEIPVRSDHQ